MFAILFFSAVFFIRSTVLALAMIVFRQVNHALPKWIFIFRDGVGDGQLRYTAEFEVPQLSECFHNFGADYNPKICVVVVQKRINQRIFRMQVCFAVILADSIGMHCNLVIRNILFSVNEHKTSYEISKYASVVFVGVSCL